MQKEKWVHLVPKLENIPAADNTPMGDFNKYQCKLCCTAFITASLRQATWSFL
jgi:hypothetical protein